MALPPLLDALDMSTNADLLNGQNVHQAASPLGKAEGFHDILKGIAGGRKDLVSGAARTAGSQAPAGGVYRERQAGGIQMSPSDITGWMRFLAYFMNAGTPPQFGSLQAAEGPALEGAQGFPADGTIGQGEGEAAVVGMPTAPITVPAASPRGEEGVAQSQGPAELLLLVSLVLGQAGGEPSVAPSAPGDEGAIPLVDMEDLVQAPASPSEADPAAAAAGIMAGGQPLPDHGLEDLPAAVATQGAGSANATGSSERAAASSPSVLAGLDHTMAPKGFETPDETGNGSEGPVSDKGPLEAVPGEDVKGEGNGSGAGREPATPASAWPSAAGAVTEEEAPVRRRTTGRIAASSTDAAHTQRANEGGGLSRIRLTPQGEAGAVRGDWHLQGGVDAETSKGQEEAAQRGLQGPAGSEDASAQASASVRSRTVSQAPWSIASAPVDSNGAQGEEASAADLARSNAGHVSPGGGSEGQRAAASLHGASGDAEVPFAHVVRQLSDGLTHTLSLRRNRVVLQLHPPELGRVRVELVVRANNELQATFLTDHPEAKQIVEGGMTALRTQLAQSGFTLGSCSVDVGDQQQLPFGQDWQQGRPDDRGFTADKAEGLAQEIEPQGGSGIRPPSGAGRGGMHLVI